MIQAISVKKTFQIGTQEISVLRGVDFSVEEGEFVAIMGPSGSGKSTLLQLLGGLDTPTSGAIRLDGTAISEQTEKERTIFRRRHVGFIFQNYQLLPTMTVEENVAFPLHADGKKGRGIQEKVNSLLDAVGLREMGKRYPNLLSGGQQQRVSIARSLANDPKILLADEPTGNLDRERAADILELLSSFHKTQKQTIIMVTHDIFAAGYADRIVLFKDGKIEAEVKREDSDYAQFVASFLA
ncbi:ABC transporter ATP-binding protein [Paenibacillus sp. J2TS4]|uniref:ABC transporter ATP-binding protein n=1 Tax=Paenibacillus sp. J2TS4 TaxID=2807194 RepID=UPI001B042A65|nr:ABC transporter ATP-binding protein [Paenibacillus sp. J2TS4]GIP35095.1 macrolide ABC transporter ATP-binding protein [Paenibacillus sp. J2TS4]